MQVPLIDWLGKWRVMQKFVAGIAPAVTALAIRRTGRQFFLQDSDTAVALASAAAAAERNPIDPAAGALAAEASAQDDSMHAMSLAGTSAPSGGTAAEARSAVNCSGPIPADSAGASSTGAQHDQDHENASQASLLGDVPEVPPVVSHNVSFLLQLAFDVHAGPQFIRALQAFASRTCYANADGDHLVGWANSSLRSQRALPALDAHADGARVMGVARADCALAAFHSCNAVATSAQCSSPQCEAHSGGSEDSRQRRAQHDLHGLHQALQVPRRERIACMLHNLTSMPWARVDCSWKGSKLSTFAHNHIQVTRGWLNMAGKNVCEHFAAHFVALEVEVQRRDEAYDVPQLQPQDAADSPRSHTVTIADG